MLGAPHKANTTNGQRQRGKHGLKDTKKEGRKKKELGKLISVGGRYSQRTEKNRGEQSRIRHKKRTTK